MVLLLEIKRHAINDSNNIRILESLLDNQPISRADLAKLNGFNKTSISTIINTLLEANLIYESGIGQSTTTGGRKPILLEFNNHAAVAISIELGTDYVHACSAYLNGELIDYHFTNDILINSETIQEILVRTIDQLIANLPDTPNGLVGIAIGVHGVVLNNQLTFSPFYNFDDFDIHAFIEQTYQCATYIENESNLATIGEYTFSTDKDLIINVNIKSGIGAGITHFGNLLRGSNGRMGEIGHTTLFPHGIKCACGNEGCLEQYASTKILRQNISRKLKLDSISVSQIAQLWQQKDTIVIGEVLTQIEYLSIGINNLISLMDPDEIIINSDLFHQRPELLEYLRNHLQSRLTNEVLLTVSSLAHKATIYGGIALVSSNYLNITQLKFVEG